MTSLAAEFFARIFGFRTVQVLSPEYYYFEQEVDTGIWNTIQVRKAKVDMFWTALGPGSTGSPGPFITGFTGKVENGLPDHLLVCPMLGADVVAMYNRDDITESGQAGNAAVC